MDDFPYPFHIRRFCGIWLLSMLVVQVASKLFKRSRRPLVMGLLASFALFRKDRICAPDSQTRILLLLCTFIPAAAISRSIRLRFFRD